MTRIQKDREVYVTVPALPPLEEYLMELKDIWSSRLLTHQGPKYAQLEQLVKEYLGVRNVTMFANGHMALEIALKALGLSDGEIVTTPYTFASTTQAIVNCGLTPVFCDIAEDTLTIDPEKIEKLITKRTKAILAVHVYGMPCDVAAIQEIADKYGLLVIYDAAHAFGEELDGVGIGCYGDASMFSFHATKVFNTVEGGCLAFKEASLYDKLCAIRQFGQLSEDCVPYYGTNAKMTEIHAAMGICNIRHINNYIEERQKAFDRYNELLKGIKGLRTIEFPAHVKPNYSYYPVLFDEDVLGFSRDYILKKLLECGVHARRYFYPLTSEFQCYKGKFEIQATPIAAKASREVLCLPLYADIEISDVESIAEVILEEVC